MSDRASRPGRFGADPDAPDQVRFDVETDAGETTVAVGSVSGLVRWAGDPEVDALVPLGLRGTTGDHAADVDHLAESVDDDQTLVVTEGARRADLADPIPEALSDLDVTAASTLDAPHDYEFPVAGEPVDLGEATWLPDGDSGGVLLGAEQAVAVGVDRDAATAAVDRTPSDATTVATVWSDRLRVEAREPRLVAVVEQADDATVEPVTVDLTEARASATLTAGTGGTFEATVSHRLARNDLVLTSDEVEGVRTFEVGRVERSPDEGEIAGLGVGTDGPSAASEAETTGERSR